MSYIPSQNLSLRAALVSNFLITELLASQSDKNNRLWLISPWITNFALNLPPGGSLFTLVDSVEPNPSLFEVLQQIARNGTQIAIVIRNEHEPFRIKQFIAPLQNLATHAPHITLRHLPRLHTKIYAGQVGVLHGSLNLTESGVERNLEFNTYAADKRTIARLRAEAQTLFESAEELFS